MKFQAAEIDSPMSETTVIKLVIFANFLNYLSFAGHEKRFYLLKLGGFVKIFGFFGRMKLSNLLLRYLLEERDRVRPTHHEIFTFRQRANRIKQNQEECDLRRIISGRLFNFPPSVIVRKIRL